MSTLLLSLCIVVWLIHLWVSYKSLGVSIRFYRRAVFSLIGLLGVFFLLYRPEVSSALPSYDAIVLTPDYNPTDLDSLQEGIREFDIYNSVEGYLASPQIDQITSIYLLGQGVHPTQAPLLQDKKVVIYPPSDIAGLQDIRYQVAEEHQPWTLELQVTTNISDAIIMSPRGTTFNLTIKDDKSIIQELPGLVAGRYTYQLKLITDSADTLHAIIPQQVRPTRDYSLMTLLQAPSFEANYFKNYWSDLGHAYAQRIRISTDKYLQNFVNRPKLQLESIENAALEGIDFVIADIIAWNQLSDNERSRVLRKVETQGLGLMFILDGDQRPTAIPEAQATAVEVIEVNTPKGPQELKARKIINTRNWNRIVQDETVLGYSRTRGRGHIGFISLEDSYKLLLADATSIYQSYWSTLLSAFYVDTDIPYLVQEADPIWAAEPTQLSLFTARALETPVLLNDSINISWINNPLIDNSYALELTPAAGWNRISIDKAQPYYFYAHAPSELVGLRYQRNLDALPKASSQSNESSTLHETIPISPWWPWAVVMIGLGLLWLDERLY